MSSPAQQAEGLFMMSAAPCDAPRARQRHIHALQVSFDMGFVATQVCKEWHRQVRALRRQLSLSDLPPAGRLPAFSHVTDLQLAVRQPFLASGVWDVRRVEQLAALVHLKCLTLIAQCEDRSWTSVAGPVLRTLQRLPRLGA